MAGEDLLLLARGPALWISLLVLVAGSLWRIVSHFRLPVRPDLSEPRTDAPLAAATRGFFARMVVRKELRPTRNMGALNAYLYHVGLAIIVFAYAPHIAFIERLTGIGWPALPDWVMFVAVGPTLVSLFIALLERLSDPVRRMLSGLDDYFSWFVVVVPVLTGMAALGEPYPAGGAPALPVNAMPLAIHLLSVELLLIWLPFGKLGHAFMVFFSRGVTGILLARKGAAI